MTTDYPDRPFNPSHTTPVIPDEQTIDAIRKVITDWDGTNWAAVYQVLRGVGRTLDEIEKMTLMDIRMAFATGQKPMIEILGSLETAVNGTSRVVDAADRHKPGSKILVSLGAKEQWLIPTTLADLANRLGNIGTKKARTILKPYGLKACGNRQSFSVRLDGMPTNIRTKLEQGR
jgi:hypothetical protein